MVLRDRTPRTSVGSDTQDDLGQEPALRGGLFRAGPPLGRDPVQNVATQRRADWHAGVVEVALRVSSQAQTLHDGSRAMVSRHGEGHHLIELQPREGEVQSRRPSFGGKASAPSATGQPPSNLYGRSEMGLEAGLPEPHEADEGRAVDDFHRPQPPALGFDVGRGAVHEAPALSLGHRGGKVLHHLGVSTHRRKRLEVAVSPLPQHQLAGPQHVAHASGRLWDSSRQGVGSETGLRERAGRGKGQRG